MSTFRTLYPNDTITVRLYPATEEDTGAVTIGYGGTHVPDEYDDLVRAQAAAVGVRLAEGGPVLPVADSLTTRVQHLEQMLSGVPVVLAEQPVRAPGGPNPAVRSGQLVPVDTTTGPFTLTLEPAGARSRVGVRLAAGTAPLSLAGTGEDVVPPLGLTQPGTVVILEGMAAGGWRPISRYTPDGAITWSAIAERPAIPALYSDLSGAVPTEAVPASIARTARVDEVADAAAVDTAAVASRVTVHDERLNRFEEAPVCEARMTTGTDVTGLGANTYWTMRSGMAAFSDPYGMFVQPGADLAYQVRVPAGWGGRWELTWQIAIDGAAYDPLISMIMLDAPSNIANGPDVFSYVAFRNQTPGMGQVTGSTLVGEGSTFGMAMYVSRTSGSFNLRPVIGNYRTKIVARWVGDT